MVKNHRATKGDLTSQALECVVLGFSGSDGYKFLNLATDKAVHSRSASFYPGVYPWQDFAKVKRIQTPDFEADAGHQDDEDQFFEPEEPEKPRRSGRITAIPYHFDPAAYVHMTEQGNERWLKPKSIRQALHPENPLRDQWWEAMLKEYKGLIDKGALKPDRRRPGDKVIAGFFLHSPKTGPTGEIKQLKSRFVANGKGEGGNVETYSPTPLWSTIRWIFKFAVDNDLDAKQIDIIQAYLLASMPRGEQYILRPPKDFPFELPQGNKYLRILKCLYGLPQSGRHWNKKVHKFVSGLGRSSKYKFIQSNADPCLYVDINNKCALLVFVDDFILVGTDTDVDDLISRFEKRFPTKNLGKVNWYLHCHIQRDRRKGVMHMSQQAFAEQILKEAGMSQSKPVSTPAVGFLTPQEDENEVDKEAAILQGRITGMLLYLAVATRLDISFAVGQLCKYISKPTPSVWRYTKRILRYLRGTSNYGLNFRKQDYGDKIHGNLVGYSDADHAGCPSSRRSWSGAVFKFGSDVITWKCKQQTTVALSSMESELVALTAAAREGQHLYKMAKDFRVARTPAVIHVDNQAAMASAKDFRVSQRSKHIATKHFYIRNLLEDGVYKLQYIPSRSNLADILTKPLKPAAFIKLRSKLNIGPYDGSDK
jgi:hypothetical protein